MSTKIILTEQQREEIKKMVVSGSTLKEVAKKMGYSTWFIMTRCHEMGIKTKKQGKQKRTFELLRGKNDIRSNMINRNAESRSELDMLKGDAYREAYEKTRIEKEKRFNFVERLDYTEKDLMCCGNCNFSVNSSSLTHCKLKDYQQIMSHSRCKEWEFDGIQEKERIIK